MYRLYYWLARIVLLTLLLQVCRSPLRDPCEVSCLSADGALEKPSLSEDIRLVSNTVDHEASDEIPSHTPSAALSSAAPFTSVCVPIAYASSSQQPSSLSLESVCLHAAPAQPLTKPAEVPQPDSKLLQTVQDQESVTHSPEIPATFFNLSTAQKAVESYLQQCKNASMQNLGIAFKEQGKNILKEIEALKKATKAKYRRAVLNFETVDVNPVVWKILLQNQKEIKSQLQALRHLRTELLRSGYIGSEALQSSFLQTSSSEESKPIEIYSSDEEKQQLSDETRRVYNAFWQGMAQVLKEHIEDLVALAIDPVDTTIEHCITLLSSVPAFPEMLVEYIEKFIEVEEEEQRVKLIGELLTKMILEFIPLPKVKAKHLQSIKQKLGKAGAVLASRVHIQYCMHEAKLPTRGQVRFIPQASDIQRVEIFKQQQSYTDKSGNIWQKRYACAPSEYVEWDVQLSRSGRSQLEHLAKSSKYLRVSMQGEIIDKVQGEENIL